MNFDIAKISKHPWYYIEPVNRFSPNEYDREGSVQGINWLPIPDTCCPEPDDAVFIVLTQNDFLVKLRRGWHTEKCTEANQWFVPQLVQFLFDKNGDPISVMYQEHHDVGLLTKANAWYEKYIEGKND